MDAVECILPVTVALYQEVTKVQLSRAGQRVHNDCNAKITIVTIIPRSYSTLWVTLSYFVTSRHGLKIIF